MRKGFTLIELIMVIVIIGILAAIAIPKFIDLNKDARTAACQADAGAINTALSNWYARFQLHGCPGGTGTCDNSGFPVATQLDGSATHFATAFFAAGTLPATANIGTGAKDWSAWYSPNTGVLHFGTACTQP